MVLLLKHLTITLWITTTIASVFAAKVACDQYEIEAVVLSLVQFAVASALLLCMSLTTGSAIRRPSSRHLFRLLLVSGGVFARETLKFASVAHIDINLFNAIKSLGPLVLILLDFVLFRAMPRRSTVFAFAILAFGGVLMGLDPLIHPTTTTASTAGVGLLIMGVVCGLLSTVVECGATIGQKLVLKDAPYLDDASVQYYLSCFSMVFAFINFVDTASHHGQRALAVHVKEDASIVSVVVALAGSALLAFVSTQLSIKSLRRVSAAQYTLLDTLRRLLSSVAACFVFGERLDGVGYLGLLISLGGVYFYSTTAARPEAVLMNKTNKVDVMAGKRKNNALLGTVAVALGGGDGGGNVASVGKRGSVSGVGMNNEESCAVVDGCTISMNTGTSSNTTTRARVAVVAPTVTGDGIEGGVANDFSISNSVGMIDGTLDLKNPTYTQPQDDLSSSPCTLARFNKSCDDPSSSLIVPSCSGRSPINKNQEPFTLAYTTTTTTTTSPTISSHPSCSSLAPPVLRRPRTASSALAEARHSHGDSSASRTRGYGSDANLILANTFDASAQNDSLTRCEATPLLPYDGHTTPVLGLIHIV